MEVVSVLQTLLVVYTLGIQDTQTRAPEGTGTELPIVI